MEELYNTALLHHNGSEHRDFKSFPSLLFTNFAEMHLFSTI